MTAMGDESDEDMGGSFLSDESSFYGPFLPGSRP